MKKIGIPFFAIIILLLWMSSVYAQDSLKQQVKKGFNLGLLPSVAFDSDLGFQYGGLLNLFNYGDGSTYPNYKYSIILEIARTTKGSGKNQFFFDSPQIFKKKNIRLTADVSYLTEQALDFYGFNGAESRYVSGFEDENTANYKSRMFYRQERKMQRMYADFQGKISSSSFRWLAGIAFYNFKMNKVDIAKLNKGKDGNDTIPNTETLFEKYVKWGSIAKNPYGGSHLFGKFGLIFDTRDIEANPGKGLWTELLVVVSPPVTSSKQAFVKLACTHRQYFTLIKNKLTFAYRAGIQTTILGETPYYFRPVFITSFSNATLSEGLGGAKTIRGILRDRVVGEGIAYGNFEFRYKFYRTIIKKQNFYFAFNPFLDAGRTIKPVKYNLPEDSTEQALYFTGHPDRFHFTLGCGLHIAMNENFIISVNYGRALNPQDGTSGFYIGTNWLF